MRSEKKIQVQIATVNPFIL